MTIIEGVYKAGPLLFNCRDDQLLLSLPIKRRTVYGKARPCRPRAGLFCHSQPQQALRLLQLIIKNSYQYNNDGGMTRTRESDGIVCEPEIFY